MKTLITGATGLVGQALTQSLLNDGHTIVVLSRRPEAARVRAGVEVHKWEPEAGPPPVAAWQDVEAVVHLAGEPVAARRWSAEQKRRIRDSRVIGTRNLVAGLRAATMRPNVLVSASAVGFYGDRGDDELDERAAAGQDFLSEVCQEWERESGRASELGMRVAQVRVGVVLSAEGGALPRMLPAFKLGVAGRLGNGQQWFPWIHIADIVGFFRHAMQSPQITGPMNAAAPGIVTNAEFTKVLASVLHRPAFLPAPRVALNLAFGEMGAVLLASLRVVPRVAVKSGYQFRYPELKAALEDLLGRSQAVAGRA